MIKQFRVSYKLISDGPWLVHGIYTDSVTAGNAAQYLETSGAACRVMVTPVSVDRQTAIVSNAAFLLSAIF
jgi:hypothetical protein